MAITYFPDDVTILGGDLVLGNTGPSPASGTPVKGTATLQPAGNTTAGELILQAKTGAGTLRSTTLKNSTTSAADQVYELPVNYPAVSGYVLSATTGGVLSWAAAGSGTVGGSGTDNHIVRWDGTGNIQDSGWVISDTTDQMSKDTGTELILFNPALGYGNFQPSAAGNAAIEAEVYGDGFSRFRIDADGGVGWGAGSGPRDLKLDRLAADLLGLAAGDAFAIQGGGSDHASTTDGTLYYRTDTDKLRLRANGAWVDIATGSASGYWSQSGTDVYPTTADDDVLLHDGSTLQWGNGNPGTADVVLSRGAANRLDLAAGDTLRLDTMEVRTTGTIDTTTGVGETFSLRAYATTGGTRVALITLTNAALAPTLDFPTGATWNGNEIYHATGTDVPLTDGGTGASTAAGALLNITGWVESFVTSAHFTTSSTTLVDITGLTFAAAANKTYEIDALLYVDTSAVTSGVKFGVNYSAAGAAMHALISCTSTSTAASISTLNTLGTASANTYLTTSDISGVCHIKGFVTTGANTGNITIRGLKVTSGTLTVYRGSRLMVRELTT